MREETEKGADDFPLLGLGVLICPRGDCRGAQGQELKGPLVCVSQTRTQLVQILQFRSHRRLTRSAKGV